ncbi:MAG TPA: nitroreductase family deazaflavin-dependent oxidoreductase [Trebonia sp.]|jgi:deazaflavin-dependent oxidoreductase (nitroreductase family)|nr:nitroreductase family deazaflavin-dependent oxidoreductase [Trebonia sp.]
MTDYNSFNDTIIKEFRTNDGRVGGRFEGATLLLLHHTGARSGAERVSPLAYLPLGESYAIFASKGGAPENPAWYHNLIANPETTIEVGTTMVKVRARVAAPAERDDIYARQVQRAPGFGEYEAKTAPYRTIPVVVLDPVK